MNKNLILTDSLIVNYSQDNEEIELKNNDLPNIVFLSNYIAENYKNIKQYKNTITYFEDNTNFIPIDKNDLYMEYKNLSKNNFHLKFPVSDFVGNKHKCYIQKICTQVHEVSYEFSMRSIYDPKLSNNLELSIFIMHFMNLNFKNFEYNYNEKLSYIFDNKLILNKNEFWWTYFVKFLNYLYIDMKLKDIDLLFSPIFPVILNNNFENFKIS